MHGLMDELEECIAQLGFKRKTPAFRASALPSELVGNHKCES